MPREVSRRTSKPPEQKGKVSRPDIPGKRDLDPKIVRDVPDPAPDIQAAMLQEAADLSVNDVIYGDDSNPSQNFHGVEYHRAKAIQRGRDMDNYFEQLGPMTEGKSK